MISIPDLYKLFLQCPGISTDTRQIRSGDLFFALKGPNFNGNSFAQKALDQGASFAIIDDPAFRMGEKTILVEDALTSLQDLAHFHRTQLDIPVLAITGSNGKTTTKELIHAVLSTVYKTYTTTGNLNNHIGVPLTLLKIKKDAEIAVVEMGANHLGEIKSYCTYTEPTHGLITNCGKAHLEGFGSIEGVRKGKGELFDFLRQTGGESFICDDFDYFHEMAKGLVNPHWYGTNFGDLVGKIKTGEPYLVVEIEKGFDNKLLLETQLVGTYNVYNVLAACIVGRHFKLPPHLIKQALETYQPTNSRSQLLEKDGNRIILDAYNANPSSMALAVENFAKLKADNKILFLGAMKELGPDTKAEHEALVAQLEKSEWKSVVLVGREFRDIPHAYQYFENAAEARSWWQQQHTRGNYLLIKGSRSTRMEIIIE